MPTLTRFITRLIILGAVGAVVIYGLAEGVSPRSRAMSVPVDSSILQNAGKAG
jgi:hypothetical protein